MPLLIAASRPRKHSQRPVTTTGILIAQSEWMAALVQEAAAHIQDTRFAQQPEVALLNGTMVAFLGR